MGITPVPGLTSVVAVGGTAVNAAGPNPAGGYIVNPVSAADQGLSGFPEPLYVNPCGAATLQANGTTFAISPGGTWNIVAGQTTPTSVNAVTSGHKFSIVVFNST